MKIEGEQKMRLGKREENIFLKIAALCLVCAFIFSSIIIKDAYAARSRAGDGDTASFDAAKWAEGTAIGIASYTLGSAISSGIDSAIDKQGFEEGFNKSINGMSILDKTSSLGRWTTSFATTTATSQASRATSMIGNYYGWDPKGTLVASSIVGGAVSGGLNPGNFGSSISNTVGGVAGATQSFRVAIDPLSGMAIGAIGGGVEGAILRGSANHDGRVEAWKTGVAGLTENMVTGGIVGGFNKDGTFSFGNNFNWSNAAGQGALPGVITTTLRSIPSTALSVGVQSRTKYMSTQDAKLLCDGPFRTMIGYYLIADVGLYCSVGCPCFKSNGPFDYFRDLRRRGCMLRY